MGREPAAFLSYTHADDRRSDISKFCEELAEAVSATIGADFRIFQDRNDIRWGEQWRERIDESLDAVTFLIPILTPRFFGSDYCRGEVERFLERERQLGRNDLILPVYFRDHPPLNDEQRRKSDAILNTIATHQYADWRELRYESVTSATVQRALDKMAVQIRDALGRLHEGERTVARESATNTDSGATTSVQEESLPASDVERQPRAKSEPPVRVVDQMHRGDHSTVSGAIRAAKPGDRILIRPGTYKESLVIDKPLEIIGDGLVSEVVVETNDTHVVLFNTTMGRIANLTLRQLGGEKGFGVDIAQGRLDLEDCDVSSESLACIAIHGGADHRIRHCRIHDGKQSGVFIFQSGKGTLEDNEIFGNTYSGVSIRTGADPTLRRNTIRDGNQTGVYIRDEGKGTLEDNEIFGNAGSGISIRTGGDPSLRRNIIRDGQQDGVTIYDAGMGTLEDNEIFGNNHSGVRISNKSTPTLCRNNIQRNGVTGVTIMRGAEPTVRENRITNNDFEGIWAYDVAGGTIEDNDLRNNRTGAWDVSEDSEATLKRARNLED